MNVRSKSIASGGIAIGAVAAVVAGVYAFGAVNVQAEPVSVVRPASVIVEPTVDPITPEDEVIAEAAREAARIEAERLEAERKAAEAEAARIAAEQAAAEEAARVAAEQQAAQQDTWTGSDTGGSGGGGTAPAPAPDPAPAPGCPSGSAEQAGGFCYWEYCFTLTIPDPAHPECDTAFRP